MEELIKQIEEYIPFNKQEERDKAQMLAFLHSGAELITRNNPVAHLTASAWVVSPDRKQVIMVYHNLYKSWSWMGGHADGDWDLLGVAKKEFSRWKSSALQDTKRRGSTFPPICI